MTAAASKASRWTAPGKREAVVVAVAFLVLWALLSDFMARTSVLKHLDSVFVFESLDSIAQGGAPTSRTVATWPEALRLFSVPVAEVCSSKLATPAGASYAILDNHAYLLLFPLGWASAVLGAELTVSLANAAAHLLLLFLPYVFLRRQGVRRAASAAFGLCIALYTGWAMSAVGDYYLDRLYMPFALLTAYLGHRIFMQDRAAPGLALAALVASALLAAACTERGAVMVAGLLAFFLLFQQRRGGINVRASGVVALTVVGIALYLFAYFRFQFVGFEGGGSLVESALATLRAPLLRLSEPGLLTFALVNAPLLPLAAWAGWRYLLLLVGAMLPNVLITTGGAELTGWATHYHAMYIPLLVFAASVGYGRLMARFDDLRQPVFSAFAVLASLVWVCALDPATGALARPTLATLQAGIVGHVYRYYARPEESYDSTASAQLRGVASMVPAGVHVSAVESAMPALYAGRRVSYYPLGLDDAEYLAISGTHNGRTLDGLTGAVSYLGADATAELNRCLTPRVKQAGYEFVGSAPGVGLVVLRRKARAQPATPGG